MLITIPITCVPVVGNLGIEVVVQHDGLGTQMEVIDLVLVQEDHALNNGNDDRKFLLRWQFAV